MATDKPEIIEDLPREDTPKVELKKESPRELLYIPVKPGDTVESIAKEYQTTVEKIVEDNKINPNYLMFGHWLFV